MKALRMSLVLSAAILSACAILPRGENFFEANVVRISEEYANINTDITAPVLAEHGIVQGSRFNVKFKTRTMQALLGKTYSDVEKGEWIALIEDDGKLQLAISFGHAATAIDCKVGDTIYIESQSE